MVTGGSPRASRPRSKPGRRKNIPKLSQKDLDLLRDTIKNSKKLSKASSAVDILGGRQGTKSPNPGRKGADLWKSALGGVKKQEVQVCRPRCSAWESHCRGDRASLTCVLLRACVA